MRRLILVAALLVAAPSVACGRSGGTIRVGALYPRSGAQGEQGREEADGVALPDPDPGAKGKKEFAWMTAHEYRASKKVANPFKDWKTLEEEK